MIFVAVEPAAVRVVILPVVCPPSAYETV